MKFYVVERLKKNGKMYKNRQFISDNDGDALTYKSRKSAQHDVELVKNARVVTLVEKSEVEKAFHRGYDEAHEQQMKMRVQDALEARND